MQKLMTAIFGCAVALAMAAPAGAINCEQVRRYLATGRTAEQIAEQMIVDVAEVKKCQQEAPKAGDATPPAAPAETK